MRTAILLLVCVFTSAIAWAETYGDWEYVVSGNNATITKYNGRTNTTTINIPNKVGNGSNQKTVTAINDDVFSGRTRVRTINIQATNLNTIGNDVFSGCTSLRSITIPASVTSIGNNVFSGCTSLSSITFANGTQLMTIGDNAFSGCTKLSSVTIPTNVTSIGDYAFDGCTSLTSITIPRYVTSIGSNPFSGCTKLTTISVNTNNSSFKAVDNVLMNKAGTQLIAYPAGKTGTSYTVPTSVTTIGNKAFDSCSKLTSIIIPANVTAIGSNAFSGCTNLKSIYMLSDQPDLSYAGIPAGCTVYIYGTGNNYANQIHIGKVTTGTNVTATVSSTPTGISSPVITYNNTDYYAEGTTFTLGYSGTGSNVVYTATKTNGGTDVTSDVISSTTLTMPIYDVTVNATVSNQIPVTITAGSTSKEYNGTPLTYGNFEVNGLPDGDNHTFTVTMTSESEITNVGSTSNVIATVDGVTVSSTQATQVGNYLVTIEAGTLEVTPKAITVKADDMEKVYDNNATNPGSYTATVTGAEAGDSFTAYTVSRATGETVGPYTITPAPSGTYTPVEGKENTYLQGNYEVKYVTGTFTIKPAAITVTADNNNKVYDNDPTNPASYTATVTGLSEGETFTAYTVSRATGEAVGPYTITAAPSGTYTAVEGKENTYLQGNYEVKYVTGTFTITPAAIKITADNKTKVYDNNATTDPQLTATVTGAVEGDEINYTLSRAAGQAVNEYEIAVTAGSNPNYTVTVEGAKFTITPAAIKITADNKTKVYDNNATTDPQLTATVTGKPENGVALSYSLSRAEGQDVDEYDITVTAAANSNPNYTVTVEKGKFKINPAAITIKADDKTKTYDNNATTDPQLTATVTGKPTNGVAPSYSLNRTAGQNVGEYDIIVTAAANSNQNYTVTVEKGKFKINPAAITIKADDKSKVYDNDATTDPQLTATVTGAVEGDEINYTLSREAGQAVGNYAITVTTGTNPNYTVSVEGGNFKITEKSITIKADDKTKVYDNDKSTDPELTATVTGAAEGDKINYSLSREDGQNVDDYIITVEEGSNPNYTVTVEAGTFSITPAAITISADDKTKVYDNDASTDPELTATVTGAVEGDEINYSLSREDGQDVDDYDITVTAGSNPNYTVNVEAGTFSITPAEITISADDKTKVYDNDASTDPELTATVTGAVEGDEINYSLSREDGQDVDDYDITVTAGSNPNYTVNVEAGTFSITPAEITISADDKTKVYDNDASTDPELTATITGAVEGDEINYSLSREDGQDVDDYDITVTVEEGSNPNYTVNVEAGTFSITPAEITIKADDKTKVYGETDPELTATVTGTVEGDEINYSLSREDGQNVGDYAITVTAGTNPNYSVNVESGNFLITQKSITIKADDQTKVYDNDESTDPELTATVTGAVEGDKINYTLSREAGQSIGDYAITVTAGTNPNYTVIVEGGTLTIVASTKALIISSATRSWEYDAQTHKEDVYTVTYNGTEIPADDTGKIFTLGTGDVVTITPTAEEVKNVGDKVKNTFTYTLTNADQYANIIARFGTLTIVQKTITIAGVKAKDKVYDGERTATLDFTNAVINGKIDGEDLTFTASGLFNTKDVGKKKTVSIVDVTLRGKDKGNYKFATTGSQRTTVAGVTERPLVVTANEKTISYGDDAANDDVSYDGFAENEDLSVLSGTLRYTYNSAKDGTGITYTANSPVGTYYIIPSGLYNENYSITYAAGILTVEAKDIDYEDGIITQDENGYTVDIDESMSSANPLPKEVGPDYLTYSRTLKAPGNSEGDKTIDGNAANLFTVCLPFTPETGTTVKYYTLGSVVSGANGTSLNFEEVEAPTANTPYLVAVMGSTNFTESCNNIAVTSTEIASTTVDGYTFKGTFTGLTNAEAESKYILQHGGKWGQVPEGNANVYLPPFRAYIESGSNARSLDSSIGDGSTSIRYIHTTDADGTEQWYDMNGRKLDKQPTIKGVYIHNGRKEVIK
ncbi:MAG: leucine-rich repeat protein [Bacteroidaceae bacterium]|nr:leucine-rich repeat protein [Bacteroidaceae bacterium]